MLKKITTLFLILILSTIVTTLSVFGWFTISDEGGEREQNTYFNSRRLFEAEMISTVYTRIGSNMVPNVVNYNSRDVYSQSTYMLKIGNINANTESNPHPLDIDIRIKPLVDINIRVFIIEEWINGSGQVVKTTPVNYVYNDTNFTYNQTSGAYEYNHVLVKDNSILIDFVNGIRTPNGAAINNGNQFNLTVYIEAKQANSPAVWDGSSYLVNGPIQTVNINFEKVTNPFFQRGVPVEIIHGDTGEKFSFIYNKNTSTRVISGLGSSTNPHILRIFIPYTIDYDVSKNGDELIITSKYRVLSHFIGIHDYVYSPAVIPVYQTNRVYQVDDIVFYEGQYYIKVNGAGNTGPSNTWHWRLLGSIYIPGGYYDQGVIVYDLQTQNYY